jgi:small subunit ribosomal protein S1
VLEVDARAKRISLGLKQLEPDPWMLFTDKYHPGDKIAGKVRSLTDYGVFVGIEEGVDGMVHKSDLSWTVRVNNPSDLYHKGDDVEAIILSINHDEKKVSLGIKQLWDDPWPSDAHASSRWAASSTTLPSSASSTTACSFGSARASRAHPLAGRRRARGEGKIKLGDKSSCEVTSVDTIDRRLFLTMKNVGAERPATSSKRSSATSCPT